MSEHLKGRLAVRPTGGSSYFSNLIRIDNRLFMNPSGQAVLVTFDKTKVTRRGFYQEEMNKKIMCFV